MNIHDHIAELRNRTQNIEMWYDYAYPSNDGPSYGMRAEASDIIIDDIAWMIYGENARVISKSVMFTTVNEIIKADADSIKVSVGAQAIIAGSIVNADLGQYICTKKYVSEKTGKNTLSLRRV